jgi:hypothetical protein
MMEWLTEELKAIAEADDLHIAPLRDDGRTYGTPTWIWSVAVNGGLYVRAWSGRRSSWFQAALRQGAGRILAVGSTREVAFEAVDDTVLNDMIDEAYRTKYRSSSYLDSMVSSRARSATVRVKPRD